MEVKDERLWQMAEECVANMGDVFYEPDEWGDHDWGADSPEKLEGETAGERLIYHVTLTIYKALLAFVNGQST